MDQVVAFLRILAGRPFRYGQCDCILALADWLIFVGRNRDIAEDVRGTYSDEASCAAVLAARGGVLRVVATGAAEMGLARVRATEAPCGAIGVVRYQRKHYGAIKAPSGRWAVKCNDGVSVVQNPKVVAAWKVI
jgi:hypothetical protein